jgi:hypothetical protein
MDAWVLGILSVLAVSMISLIGVLALWVSDKKLKKYSFT